MKKQLLSMLVLCLHFTLDGNDIYFKKHIRPTLSDKYFTCHCPSKNEVKDKLALHTFELATKAVNKKKMRFTIKPASLDKSTLWERIMTDAEDDITPPLNSHKTLSKAEKELIRQWLLDGPNDETHCSFSKVKQQLAPAYIDHFIAKNLHEQDLSSSPQAYEKLVNQFLASAHYGE